MMPTVLEWHEGCPTEVGSYLLKFPAAIPTTDPKRLLLELAVPTGHKWLRTDLYVMATEHGNLLVYKNEEGEERVAVGFDGEPRLSIWWAKL